jgi:hypothetical protein
VRATGAADEDAVLAEGIRIVGEKPRTATDLAGRIGTGLKDRLADRLAAQGLLERHDDRVLGLFPRTRWPAAASTHESQVRERLRAVVVGGAQADERTIALAGILQALDRLRQVLDLRGAEAREAKRRVTALTEGELGSKAVREAVEAAISAVTTSVVTATVVTSSSS